MYTSWWTSIKESHFGHDNVLELPLLASLFFSPPYRNIATQMWWRTHKIFTSCRFRVLVFCSHFTRTSVLSNTFHWAQTSNVHSSHRQAVPNQKHVLFRDDLTRIELRNMTQVSPTVYFDLAPNSAVQGDSKPLRKMCEDWKFMNVPSPPEYNWIYLYLDVYNQHKRPAYWYTDL